MSNWSGDVNGTTTYDSRFAVGTSWAPDAIWVKNTMFDYAERPKPKSLLPTFPDDDYSFHFFIGANGAKVLYNRFDKKRRSPVVYGGTIHWWFHVVVR